MACGGLPEQPPGFREAAEIRQIAGKVGKIKSSHGFLPFQIVAASVSQGSIIFPSCMGSLHANTGP